MSAPRVPALEPGPARRTTAPKDPARYSMTAGEVARLLGLSATTFWQLRRTRPDFPAPVRLWPRARPLWDRPPVAAWWRAQVRQAQRGERTTQSAPQTPHRGASTADEALCVECGRPGWDEPCGFIDHDLARETAQEAR